MMIGLALGLMAGLGLIVVRHTLDRIRQVADAEETAGISALVGVAGGRRNTGRRIN